MRREEIEENEGGYFGEWSLDERGMPVFKLDLAHIEQNRNLVLPSGGWKDLIHQVGSGRITATAHASGAVSIYVFDLGPVRLCSPRFSTIRPVDGFPGWEDHMIAFPLSAAKNAHVSFGQAYAQWVVSSGGIETRRKVRSLGEDIPVLLVSVEFAVGYSEDEPGTGRGALTPTESFKNSYRYVERWEFSIYPLVPGLLMSKRIRPPAHYDLRRKLIWNALFAVSSLARTLTEILRNICGKATGLRLEFLEEPRAAVLTPKRSGKARDAGKKPLIIPRFSGALFVSPLDEDLEIDARGKAGQLTVTISKRLANSGRRRESARFLVGICGKNDVRETITRCLRSALSAGVEPCMDFKIDFSKDTAISREMMWHLYYLLSAKAHDAFFGCDYIPQGSAYGFVHGAQGAARDYALSIAALVYFDPFLARDMLRLIMKMTDRNGSVFYSHLSSGYCTSALVHPFPGDLPIFFLWALCEYVFSTSDYDFLEEEIPFYSLKQGKKGSGSVLERVVLAFRFLTDKLGVGKNGMLRVGGGDWNDPLALMTVNPRRFRKNGESAFSTAFAAYVLPRAAEILKERQPGVSAAMVDFAGSLRKAMEEAWTGRWFLRGWDGLGNPIGDEHLFLDAQVWCLIAGIGSMEIRQKLVDNIRELCDKDSPIAATILDRSHPVRFGILPPGWDVNGGVWAAISSLLAWAYSLYDRDLAWKSFKKQLLSSHAARYPHVWYGIWSGPDAYNAHYAERPGETFRTPATPMDEFPVMNSNAHAGPLLALMKLVGIESNPEGIRISPRLPEDTGDWLLKTALFRAWSKKGMVHFVRT